MSKITMIPLAVALIPAIVAATPAAGVGTKAPQDAVTSSRDRLSVMGSGYGNLSIPDTRYQGYFNAVLQDENGTDRFIIQGATSLYLASYKGVTPPPFQIGGITGLLRPLPPPGYHTILPLPPIGWVEGLWRLRPDNRGNFDLEVLARSDDGSGAKSIGHVGGDFAVSSIEFIHPPMTPPPGRPTVDSDSVRLRPKQVAGFTLNGRSSSSGRPAGAGSPPPRVDGAGMAKTHSMAGAIGAQETLGTSGFDDAGNVGVAKRRVAYFRASSAQAGAVRPGMDVGGTPLPDIAVVDGSTVRTSSVRRPMSQIGAGETLDLVTLDGSGAETSAVRPKSDTGAMALPNIATPDGSSVQSSRVRPKVEVGAEESLRLADLDDLPLGGDGAELQQGRLKLRYVFFR